MRTLAFSVLLVPLVFASLLMAVNQSLHEKLHHDASKTSHQCAITLFAEQQLIESEPDTRLIELSPGLILWIADARPAPFSSADYRFSASRAPPISFL